MRKKIEAELMSLLESQEMKSASAEIDGVKYTATVTARTTTTFDEGGLKKALGARAYNKLTYAKLDRHKLSTAIDEGTVDPSVVSQYTSVETGARTVRLTRKVANDEAAEA